MYIVNKLNKVLPVALMLLVLFGSCSSEEKIGDGEDWLFVGAMGSMDYIEFEASLSKMEGDVNALESFMPDRFKLYGFNSALGFSMFGYTSSTTAQGVDVTRNTADSARWDYVDSKTQSKLKWTTFLKYPVSFYAIGGEGASQAKIGALNKLPLLQVNLPVGTDGTVRSEETHDLLFAQALRLYPLKYQTDSLKVALDFKHILPLVNLRASLADANDLEVTVRSATLMGLVSAAELDFNSFNPHWGIHTSGKEAAKADIVLALEKPVTLGAESAALQDCGAYIVPQTVRAWTTAAQKDGAGVKLDARVRSKATGTYLVGSESSYGQVYVPIDNMTFASNTAYTFDITFNVIYDSNGSMGFRASWKPVVTPWVEKDDNLVYE